MKLRTLARLIRHFMIQLGNFFILCSGAHRAFIEQCPTERTKYTGLGAAIFFTGVFAFIAASYALYTVFNSYITAIGLGLVWGLMIFNLDRYIVSSMRKEGRVVREFWAAMPRLVVAVIISFVIAKPLELRIFQKEIEPELVVMEQKAFAKQEEEVRRRFSALEMNVVSEIRELETLIHEKETQTAALVRIAQEEADGTGGSRQKNLGPIYKLKKDDAIRSERELESLRSEFAPRISVLEKKRADIDSARSSELRSLELNKRDGIAARMEALETIKSESTPIWWASFFITLLLIALETVPVFVKLISPRGPYDHLLKIEETKFLFQETEYLAQSSAQVRKKAEVLDEEERAFIQHRLNETLRRG